MNNQREDVLARQDITCGKVEAATSNQTLLLSAGHSSQAAESGREFLVAEAPRHAAEAPPHAAESTAARCRRPAKTCGGLVGLAHRSKPYPRPGDGRLTHSSTELFVRQFRRRATMLKIRQIRHATLGADPGHANPVRRRRVDIEELL